MTTHLSPIRQFIFRFAGVIHLARQDLGENVPGSGSHVIPMQILAGHPGRFGHFTGVVFKSSAERVGAVIKNYVMIFCRANPDMLIDIKQAIDENFQANLFTNLTMHRFEQSLAMVNLASGHHPLTAKRFYAASG